MDSSQETLNDVEKRVLAFEKRTWRSSGEKEQAIIENFDFGVIGYYQLLFHLLDDKRANALEPVLMKRLRASLK